MSDENWAFLSLPELTKTGIYTEADSDPSTFAFEGDTAIRHGHRPYDQHGLPAPVSPDFPFAEDTAVAHNAMTLTGESTDMLDAASPPPSHFTPLFSSGLDDDLTMGSSITSNEALGHLHSATSFGQFTPSQRSSRVKDEYQTSTNPDSVASRFDTGTADPSNAFAASTTVPGDLLHLSLAPTQEAEARAENTDIIAGRYRLEEPIGEGGMGSVYRATHLRLGKAFALKRMHGGLSGDPYLRDLFYREARLASSLSHPNIVSVVDYGEDRALGAFMVMELVTGASANAGSRGKSLPLRKALEILLQIAEALHYSHSKGVIHCDVKPDNILVSETPVSGKRILVAKLVDFGLANLLAATQIVRGGVHGTAQYLAPERFMGAPPHPSMDIFSLGVVAYELITGTVPFPGPAPHSQLHTKPNPLRSSSGESIDERVDALVSRMLHRDHIDRHKDMGAVIFELRTAMDMLGFSKSRSRHRPARVTNAAAALAESGSERTRQALRAFELIPIPLALLTGEGVILSANRAMVDFLGRGRTRVEGQLFADPMLLTVYPQFRADLRYVNIINQGYTRRLQVLVSDGRDLELYVHMSPGESHSREVLVTIMKPPLATEGS